MKFSKNQMSNLFFFVIVAILLIPQTRRPIQVFLQKGMAMISPSIESNEKMAAIKSYDWKLKEEDGSVYDFQDAKGKVVLINFWATWCPPCIAEMPSLQKLYDDYQDKAVFLFVTTDWFSKVKTFKEKNDYTFKVYRPVSNKFDFFNIKTIPRTYLIDKNGQIVIDESGAANWNSQTVRNTIDGLLAQ